MVHNLAPVAPKPPLRTILLGLLQGDSLRCRIAAGVLWTVLGAGISQGLGLIATVVCARLLGREEYGHLGILVATVNLFATVGSIGLGVTATRHVAEFSRSDPQRAGRIIGLSFLTSASVGLVAAGAVFWLAPWLSRSVLNAPALSSGIRLAAPMILFAAINNYQTGALSGFEAFKVLAILSLIRGCAAFPMIICGVIWGGLPGAVLAYSMSALFTFVIYEVAIRRCAQSHGSRISYRFARADIRLVWSYSVPVMLAGLSFTPAAWWSSTMLARSTGYSELGLFNAAFQWQTVMMFLSTAVSNLGLPMLSAALPERDIAKYKRLLGINFALTTGLTLLVALPTAIGAGWIMSFYGHQFHGGAAALRLVCLATVLSAGNITVGQAIWSLDAAVSGMVLGVLRGLALLAGSYYLAGEGATGLAGAYVFMGVVQTIVQAPFMFWLLRRHATRWATDSVAPECISADSSLTCLIQ